MAFLKGLPARILMIVLLFQAVAYYAIASRPEAALNFAPLSVFPTVSNGWTVLKEFPLEADVQEVLRADDTLNRVYRNPEGNAGASLFIAFFRTQRYGQSPHSPKNCLPGAGWQPVEDTKLSIAIPGRDAPIVVNKYTIARGDEQSLVLYWYQSHNRAIAGELSAKLWLVADAVRYHRSDTALVRVVVPVPRGDRQVAEKTGVELVRAVYPDLIRHFPN
jgi:EpsI family protein